MGKITGYAPIGAADPSDLLITVDVSDTTMAPTGTDKKITLAQLAALVIATLAAQNPASFTAIGISVPGGGLRVAEGPNCKQGTTTLNGTADVTIANTSVTANSRIFLTSQAAGGNPGVAFVSSRIPGTSFSIRSTTPGDTSPVAYLITEPG